MILWTTFPGFSKGLPPVSWPPCSTIASVYNKLVIYATGKVTGRIRYGKVVIEEGGQLSGDIECSVSAGNKVTSKHAMALAA